MIKAKDIHLIQKGDRYVVFHPESLSLFFVTEDVGERLKSHEISSKCMNSDIDNDINDILTHFSENIALDSAKDFKWTNSELRALSLLVSQDCNLRCGYCYADHGTFRYGTKLMSYDTAKKCIDKLLNKDDLNHISFFGGEPLLNFSLIKMIDSYLNKNKFSVMYSMITNGTIMNDEIKNFINEKFLNLGISLDGPKEVNDMQRFGRSFESAHDHVVDTIDRLRPRTYPITIKSTITRRSANRLTEIVDYISSLNIDSIDIRSVKYISTRSEFFMDDGDYATYVNGISKILVDNVNKLANGENVKSILFIRFILMLMLTKTRWIYSCAAGRGLITITADGDVYPCEKYIGLSEFHMGNVHDDDFPGERFKVLREMFCMINVYNSPDCSECWARYLCGGGCHLQSYVTHGDMSQPIERMCMETKTILEALLPEIAEIFSDETKTCNVLNWLKSNERFLRLNQKI